MKKILSLLLILTLVMTSFIACSKEDDLTAQELYDKVNEESVNLTNLSFLADFDLEVSGMEAMGIAGPMGLEISGDMKDQETMKLSLNVDTGQGMVIEGDIYYKDQVMLINAPLLQSFLGYQYIQLDMNAIAEEAGIDTASLAGVDQEKAKAVMERFEEESDFSLNDLYKLDEAVEEATVTVNEEEVKTKKITASMALENIDEFAVEFIKFAVNDEEARELFFAQMPEEQIVALEEAVNSGELQTELNKALEMITFNALDMVMYIDDAYHTVKTEINADLTVDDGTQTMNFVLTGFVDAFNIGGVEDVVLPEVAPEEVMNLSDMY